MAARADTMKAFLQAFSKRFFSVMTPIGQRVDGRSTGNIPIEGARPLTVGTRHHEQPFLEQSLVFDTVFGIPT